jgi:hypothetical protein
MIDSRKVTRSDLFIDLADAVPADSVEGKTLSIKVDAAGYYSAIKGLNDLMWAKDAIAGVNSSQQSLNAADHRIDGYSDIASADATSQLTVKLLGIAPFMPYLG